MGGLTRFVAAGCAAVAMLWFGLGNAVAATVYAPNQTDQFDIFEPYDPSSGHPVSTAFDFSVSGPATIFSGAVMSLNQHRDSGGITDTLDIFLYQADAFGGLTELAHVAGIFSGAEGANGNFRTPLLSYALDVATRYQILLTATSFSADISGGFVFVPRAVAATPIPPSLLMFSTALALLGAVGCFRGRSLRLAVG